jgi:hypothetical protein
MEAALLELGMVPDKLAPLAQSINAVPFALPNPRLWRMIRELSATSLAYHGTGNPLGRTWWLFWLTVKYHQPTGSAMIASKAEL